MPRKDPHALLDYAVDWSPWLEDAADEIDTVTWIVPPGLVKESQALADGKATVWLSGGTAGTTYPVVCRIATTGGRIDDRTLSIYVMER